MQWSVQVPHVVLVVTPQQIWDWQSRFPPSSQGWHE